MALPLTYYGHPILTIKTTKIEKITPLIKKLAREMISTMYQSQGVGLAAPQIGHSLRLTVIDVSGLEEEQPLSTIASLEKGASSLLPQPLDLSQPLILLNPEFSFKGTEKTIIEEGCLSIPEVHLSIERPVETKVTYQDLEGKHWEIHSRGFLSRVLQHEIDHLDGILMIDRAAKKEVAAHQKQLNQLKAHGLSFS